MKRLIVECLGTFFFVFSIVAMGDPLAIAGMLMAWTYIGGYISGAHYNPAVTLAAVIHKRFDWTEALYYMLVQIAGAFLAYALASYLTVQVGFAEPAMGINFVQGLIVEILLAFTFVLIALTMLCSEKYPAGHVFGLGIGFTVPALIAIGGQISGGLFNPAIAIGSALFGLVSKTQALNFPHLLMYAGGAFAGGALAAYTFDYFMSNKK